MAKSIRSNQSKATTDQKGWEKDLAEAVRVRRLTLNLTRLELSRLSGCGTAFLYQLEHGKRSLRLDKLVDVLTVLGMQLSLHVGSPGLAVGDVPS